MAQRITPLMSSPTGVARDLSPVTSDTENGNVVTNLPSLQFVLDNTDGTEDVTATFTTTATVRGYAVEDLTTTVPAGGMHVFGDFPRHVFGSELHFTTTAPVPIRFVYA